MAKQIQINGRNEVVLNTLSFGPGTEPHTYELKGRRYVYEIAGEWWLQEPGQFKRKVEVATQVAAAHVLLTATHETGSSITIRRSAEDAPRTVELLRQSGYVSIVEVALA